MSAEPPPPYTESTSSPPPPPPSSARGVGQSMNNGGGAGSGGGENDCSRASAIGDTVTIDVVTDAPAVKQHDARVLPSYDDVTCAEKLPTYEEVQQQQQQQNSAGGGTAAAAGGGVDPSAHVRVWQLPTVVNDVDSSDHHHHHQQQQQLSDAEVLGTDLTFLAAFLVSFLFNWVGFLALLCFCRSVAARYGALAGFGLSLAKWTLIVKNNTMLVSHDNLWLWWLIMAFGLVICVRAVLQYFYIKREWQSLSDMTRRRLVLFY